jgi:hypothetical protein
MRGLIRAPLWLIGLLLLAAIVVGVYAYFTTPLPYGLSAVVHTPGGGPASAGGAASTQIATAANARAAAGQPLTLGAASVVVQALQRNQDLTTNGRGGPPGSFTVVDVVLQNVGAEPLTLQPIDFRLLDDRGRSFAVDAEATRSTNTFAHRRTLFDASVPPGGELATYLAFETPGDTNAQTLRVTLGYGDLELPNP